jgi:hypothetical protein
MSREKFSAEDILLGIHFAKREVSRTRPFKGDEDREPEDPSEEYLSARKELSRWNARARRYSIRREKELEGFPIEFGIPDVYFDGDRGGFYCRVCDSIGTIPKEIGDFEKAAAEFQRKHSHKKEGSK